MNKTRLLKIASFSIALMILLTFSTDGFSQFKSSKSEEKTTSTKDISDSKATLGLKEALSVGVEYAVKNLGRENGFLDNVDVKIPVPKSLKNSRKHCVLPDKDKRVDDFVGAMNHAAEKAVPVAFDVFVDSIKQMTFNDAQNILFSGQDDAATQFFRRTNEDKSARKIPSDRRRIYERNRSYARI